MKKQRTKFLYFSKISGVGELNCFDCGTVSKMHAHTHGRQGLIDLKDGTTAGGHSVSNTGHQCQTCGNLTTVSRVYRGTEEMTAEIDKMITEGQYYCECGGELKFHENKSKSPISSLARRRRKGFTCQKCNKFYLTLSVDEVYKKVQIIKDKHRNHKEKNSCKCGGELKRTEPIFCPVCMSFNVNFEMIYIT